MRKECVIFILVLILSSCQARKQKIAKELIPQGILEKSFVNFRFPLKQKAKRLLFYECTIHNNTQEEMLFNFPYDLHDMGRNYNLFVIFENGDSANIYCKNSLDRDFVVQPNQIKNINFSLDSSDFLYKKNSNNEYHLFLDSLSFVTKEIIYKYSNDSIFKFIKSPNYVTEHRFHETFTVGTGFKD